MNTLIYPGSFDPPHRGHLDIIERAAALCDRLVVAVMVNETKVPFISAQERAELIRLMLPPPIRGKVYACVYEATINIVQAARIHKATVVRGMRNAFDIESCYDEVLNHAGIEVIHLLSRPAHLHISSSAVKSCLHNHIGVGWMVPYNVHAHLLQKASHENHRNCTTQPHIKFDDLPNGQFFLYTIGGQSHVGQKIPSSLNGNVLLYGSATLPTLTDSPSNALWPSNPLHNITNLLNTVTLS